METFIPDNSANSDGSPLSIDEEIQKWIYKINEHSQEHGEKSITDYTPKLGLEFESEDVAYEFYKEHSKRVGFGIRREYRNVSKKDGVVTSRMFTCSKEGERPSDKRDKHTKEPRAHTRTKCGASMLISLDRKIKKYKVTHFVAEHNHPLQPPQCVHKIQCHRHIPKVQASQIELAEQCGIRLKDSHEFIAKQAGGKEILGFTRVDQKNYLKTKRQQSLRYGEVGALLSYFQKQANENPSFFYEYQMDIEEQTTNIFWADAQMINDYNYFGDVVTFDTTYKTNKDYRPLGVFIGFNNHRQTVVFGATLFYDETIPSFEWLFETFLKAMGGRKPKTILTDQAPAMANALSLVMPETFHGLCTWHIRENALRHVNHLYHKHPEFSKRFEALIDVYEEEKEFVAEWDSLLSDYKVPDDSWLHTIIKVKEKWAWAYVSSTFTAGMRSTQLSESLNADLKNHLKSDLNLVQFFTHFERVVNSKRENEEDAEFDARDKLPKLKMAKAPMLVQAAKIYTPRIFMEFQEDYDEYQGAFIKESKDELYIVANVDNSKERMVVGNRLKQTVACECRKFETHGILCSHAMKVLDFMNIKFIPDDYILKRWTRDARQGTNYDWKGQEIILDRKAHFTKRYKELAPRMVRLTTRASESHGTSIFLSKVFEEASKMVEKMLATKTNGNDDSTSKGRISIQIGNDKADKNVDHLVPRGIRKRGCTHQGKRRPKTWLEKANRKRNGYSSKERKAEESEDACQGTEQTIIERSNDPAPPHSTSQTTRGNAIYINTSHTYTQLLTEPLDYNSISLSTNDMVLFNEAIN